MKLVPSFVTRLFSRKQYSGSISHPQALLEYLLAHGAGKESTSGVTVTPGNVMSIAAVYGCVRVISETIASVPLRLFAQEPDGSRELALKHPLYSLLEVRPNPWQTSFEFIEMVVAHCCLRGNAYVFKNIVRNLDGQQVIRELIPIHPDRMRMEVDNDYTVRYFIKPYDGQGPETPIPPEVIWHIRGLTVNGFMGVSVLQASADVFGNAISMQRQLGKMMQQGTKLSGVLEHPGELGSDAAQTIMNSWKDTYSGTDNAYKVAVLEEGMRFREVQMTAQDAQFVEQRKYSWNEICAIFRVPPHKVMNLERATFSNIEHQAMEFVTDCIMPWARRIEQSIQRDLLVDVRYYPKFMLQALLRGDSAARAEFYASAITNGWMNRNEARVFEDMNKGGKELDKFLEPLNMQGAGEKPPAKPNDEETRKLILSEHVTILKETVREVISSIKQPELKVDVDARTTVQEGAMRTDIRSFAPGMKKVKQIARPVMDEEGKILHVEIEEIDNE